jgi:ligand-binding sensor domain-containing protein
MFLMGTRKVFSRAWFLALLLIASTHLRAEQLPIRTYPTADEASDQVARIVRDSHGFLWFCTVEGLSRFDGYKFTNYTTADGLPHRTVDDLLETKGGVYWVATEGGLSQFNPNGYRPRNAASAVTASDSPIPQSTIRDPQSNEPMFISYRPVEAKKD